jgi:glycosyltransferase involved in cell wall biosynthesis
MADGNPLRVLAVDEEVPFPLNTGKRLRTFNLLRRLQERHRITWVCYGDLPEGLPALPNVDLVTLKSPLIPQQGPAFYLALLRNVLSPLPYVVDRHYSAAMRETIAGLLGRESYDLLYCEWTPYTRVLADFLDGYPSVLSTHNVEALIWQRLRETEANLAKKLYIGLQCRKMFHFEKQAVGHYTAVTAVSDPDRQLLAEWYGADQATVVPNGVDEACFVPRDEPVLPGSMVFTGSMDWRPNQDAMKFFLNEIYPLVLKELPGASLAIVGRQPPAWLSEMATRFPNVTVTGTVADVRPHIATAALYIVPLRIGGGSRLKILEALAMEKIVLSTGIGAEGLDLADGKDLLLADGAAAFARTAVDVLKRREAYLPLAAAGRWRVLDSYTWGAIANVMDGVWRRAAGQG